MKIHFYPVSMQSGIDNFSVLCRLTSALVLLLIGSLNCSLIVILALFDDENYFVWYSVQRLVSLFSARTFHYLILLGHFHWKPIDSNDQDVNLRFLNFHCSNR